MPRLFTLLALALAIPAFAADLTEEIRLEHLPAVELERLLLASQWRAPEAPGVQNPIELLARGSTGVSGQGLLPDGIRAWSVNPERNTLAVTGTAEGIKELRGVVRILDVPARRIRVSVRVFQPDRPTAERLKAELSGPAEVGQFATFVADEAQVRAFEARPRTVTVDTSVANNRPLCLRLPWEKDWPDAAGVVVPRLNGDGTVTFSAAVSMARPARGDNSMMRQFTAIRRLAKGQGWVLGSANPDIAWLVVFLEVAPDAEPVQGR